MLRVDAQIALNRMHESAEVEFTAQRNAAANATQGGKQPKEAQEGREPKARVKYKVEHAPKLSIPANKLMYTCSELMMIFNHIVMWTAPKCKQLSTSMSMIQQELTAQPNDVARILGSLTEASRVLDEELAAEFASNLPKCLVPDIIKNRNNHMIGDQASALRILQALKNRVEAKTKSRGSTLLLNLLNREPCSSTVNLQRELEDIKDEYESLRRMGCTPADEDTIMHPALVRAMEKLKVDTEVGATVLAEMAAVERTDPGNASELWAVLKNLALDWAVDHAESLSFEKKAWHSEWDIGARDGDDDREADVEDEIKRITDHVLDAESRDSGIVAEYECEWEGYPDPSDRTWHEVDALKCVKRLVWEYHEVHQELVMPEGFEDGDESNSDDDPMVGD